METIEFAGMSRKNGKKTHHAENENRRPVVERRYIERRHWLDSIKIASGCVDCKIWGPPEILTFDHVRGDKRFNIGQSWNQGRTSLEAEIDKCEIVCANCHAIRTKKRNKDKPAFIPFPKIPRLSREAIVTEKIDGTNGVVWVDGECDVWAGCRTRWLPRGGVGDDNYGFAKWVAEYENEFSALGPCILHGEWWGQGINRKYGLKEKRFSLFNVTRWDEIMFNMFKIKAWENGDRKLPRPEFIAPPTCCYTVPVITTGIFGEIDIPNIMRNLEIYGSHAVPGFMKPEGIVIYHVQGNQLFKKTINNDEEPKSLTRSNYE